MALRSWNCNTNNNFINKQMKKLIFILLIAIQTQAQDFNFQCVEELFTSKFTGSYENHSGSSLNYLGSYNFNLSNGSIILHYPNLGYECYSTGSDILTYDDNSRYSEIDRETSDSLFFTIYTNSWYYKYSLGFYQTVLNITEDRYYNSSFQSKRTSSYLSTDPLEICDCDDVSLSATIKVDDTNSIPRDMNYVEGDTIIFYVGRNYRITTTVQGAVTITDIYLNGVYNGRNLSPTLVGAGTLETVFSYINAFGLNCLDNDNPQSISWDYEIREE